ncbi:MAG: MFS transporter [Chloroflexota bacterium]|nr:MFS transporter [Chloroflexota bacterium]NOG65162.1 BCD family MFS transporter [Chloroflexota bacterium]GIK63683.1 MAG: MFS transporter [Chloroflexota bacterium]
MLDTAVEASAVPKTETVQTIPQLDVVPAEQNLPVLRNVKIGMFNVGSALADLLGSGVWNRIMIADLGYPATPISLLLALNYFLAPLAVWTGQRSDHTHWHGYRRLPFVWGGRGLMAIGFMLLAFMTVELAETGNSIWWVGIVAALFINSVGYALSGSTYTTLIYDRAPEHQRGRAVGLAWTMLLAGYAFSGALTARLLPEYSPEGLLGLFGVVVALMAALWFFSILGEERRRSPAEIRQMASPQTRPNFMDDLRTVWSNRTTRLFFLYIGLSFMGAFAQDQILEPFGGQVFDFSTGETNRFAAFWGTTALLGSIIGLTSYRRVAQLSYARINKIGLGTLIATFAFLALCAFGEVQSLIRPTLLLFGLGLGLWNIGTWGLMVSVSSAERAGTYFGLWTMASLLFRGGGSVIGAALRDSSHLLGASYAFSYGTVFVIEMIVLSAALMLISRLNLDFKRQVSQNEVLLALTD